MKLFTKYPGKENTTFRKFLLSYILMMVLPIFFAFFTYRQAIEIAEQSCVETSMVALGQAESRMEQYISVFDNVAYSLSSDSKFKLMMKQQRPGAGSKNIYEIRSFANEIRQKVPSFSLYDLNYQIIFRQNEFVFTPNGVQFGLEFFFKTTMNYPDLSFKEWSSREFSVLQNSFLPVENVIYRGLSSYPLIYVAPLNVGTSGNGQNGGVIQFLLSQEELESILSPASFDGNGYVLVLRNDGTLIHSYDPSEGGDPINMDMLRNDKGFYFSDDQHTMVVYTKSPDSELIFAAGVPREIIMSKAISVKYTTILTLVLYALIGVLLCLLLAWRSSKPIGELVESVNYALYGGKPPQKRSTNEYEYLKEEFTHILHTSRQAELENKRSSYNYLFDRLLYGQFDNREMLLDSMRKMGVELDGSGYCTASIILKNTENNAAQMILNNIRTIKECFIRTEKYKGYLHLSEPDTIVALFVVMVWEAGTFEEIESQVLQMAHGIEKSCGERPQIGIGNPCQDMMDIQFSFGQSHYAADSEEAKNNPVVWYQNLPESQNVPWYPEETEHKLITCAKAGESSQLQTMLQELYDENFVRRRLTKNMKELLNNNLLSTLLRIPELTSDHFREVSQLLNGHKNEEEKFRDIQKAFLSTSDQISRRKISHNTQLKEQVIAYVQENYRDSMLCVPLIAEKFNLSESYFSQFFKDAVGDTFSSYLENLRIRKACEILDEQRVEVEQLTQMVGYNNSNTFRRAFKRVTGLAPSAYRKAR